MRTYSGWSVPDFARFKNMMFQVFYPMNHDFLTHHNGDRCLTHFYANWDLCNMTSVLAIGVLSDDRTIYNEAIDYFKNGGGCGAIGNVVYYLHPGNLGQWQVESGRDQGHVTLGMDTFADIIVVDYHEDVAIGIRTLECRPEQRSAVGLWAGDQRQLLLPGGSS
jgi:hypothetical protein